MVQDETRARRSQPQGEIQIDSDGVSLFATAVGSGAPVLLLHAGGEDRRVWAPVAAALAAHALYCVAIDQRGHGQTSRIDADRLDSYVADAARVLALFDAPAVLIGASLGGFAALMAAAAQPARVAGVVLVDVVPDPEPDRSRTNLARITDDRGRRELAGHAELVADILSRAEELRAAAHALQVPMLLVRGSDSWALVDADVARLRALVPALEVVVVQGASHLVAREQPARLATELQRFISSAAVRARHQLG